MGTRLADETPTGKISFFKFFTKGLVNIAAIVVPLIILGAGIVFMTRGDYDNMVGGGVAIGVSVAVTVLNVVKSYIAWKEIK